MHEWTKKQEIALINEKQSFYVDSLIKLLLSDKSKVKKTINFNSSTGTGKTKMMAELFNKMPDKFFIVTTLSRGQLQRQVKKEIKKFCPQDNFYVYGLQDYTTATILTAKEITSLLPKDKEIIWVRDEGHIKTNRWEEILQDHCINKVNFSATNKDKHDISCNFTETMMLRTVSQKVGDPEEAIKKLVEIKKLHSKVADYNPCALFRLITVDEYIIKKQVVELCNQYNLKYIDLTDKDFVMDDICQDNNPYDVIINKMKIVEGIDIRRCHVLYMDNKPNNLTTTIQVIGRCRRNALLWRDDVDLFAPSNSKLLEDTRRCYVFFNVKDMSVDEKDGELLYELCDRISVEQLTEDVKIFVKNGVLPNGLQIIELEGKTGYFTIRKDEVLGFKIVENDDFYKEEKRYYKNDYCEVYYKTITYDKLEKRLNKYVWDKLGKKCGIPKSMTYDKIKEKTEKCKKSHNGRDKEFWQKILKEKPKNDDVYHWVDWYGYYDTPKYEGKYLTTWKKILQSRPQGSNSVNYKLDVDIYTRRRDREMIDKEPLYINHKKVINDKETAIIGADKFRFVEKKWVEDRAVTSKITMYSKLNTYISTRYKKEIDVALKEKFSGKNTFGFDKKLNSCLGFCVE
ncbi:MAG: hypothetical protein FWC82_02115, partial [Firmicutes bacterium]|nr:hypothetical protein [Bacillota bacterium]